MRRYRVIRATVLSIAILCLQAGSASASSTLLSGYGGPGQGNQAIIGATLIGGGGGSGGSAGSGSSSAGTAAGAPTSIALAQPRSKHAGKRSAGRGAGGHRAKSGAPARTTGSTGSARSAVPAAARSTGGALGLTGADALYIILACCLLLGTAFLTVRVNGRGGRADGAR